MTQLANITEYAFVEDGSTVRKSQSVDFRKVFRLAREHATRTGQKVAMVKVTTVVAHVQDVHPEV